MPSAYASAIALSFASTWACPSPGSLTSEPAAATAAAAADEDEDEEGKGKAFTGARGSLAGRVQRDVQPGRSGGTAIRSLEI